MVGGASMDVRELYRVVVCGGTSLLRECCQLILENTFEIVLVVSEEAPLLEWAHSHGISCSTYADFLRACSGSDILFSVVNLNILPAEVLQRFQLCINFHDSPLPMYAGLHATTRALVNCEREHAISWHLIEPGIDTGHILESARFPIEQDDTSFTLNLRSFSVALDAFRRLLQSIRQGNLMCQPQDSSNRSYYGLQTPWRWNGFFRIDVALPSALSANVRARDFGPGNENPVGSAVIMIKRVPYIVRRVRLQKATLKAPSGTVIRAAPLVLATLEPSIHIELSEVTTVFGENLAAIPDIQVNKLLSSPTASVWSALDEMAASCWRYQSSCTHNLVSMC